MALADAVSDTDALVDPSALADVDSETDALESADGDAAFVVDGSAVPVDAGTRHAAELAMM